MLNLFRPLFSFCIVIGAATMLTNCGGDSSDDAAKAAKPKLTIAYSQTGSDSLEPEILLSGLLPSSLSKEPLLDAIRSSFAYPVKTIDNIVQKPNVPAPDWYALLPKAIPGLFSKSSSITITLDGRALEVKSVSETVEDKDAIARDSVLAFSGAIDYVNHRLRVEKIKPRPSQLSITMDEAGKVVLRGLINTDATRTNIETVLRNETWHGSDVRISNEIETRPYAEAPKWAEELQSFLPLYFDTLQERSLFINSDSVRLGGKVRSEQEKSALVYAAGRAFLDSDLPVADTLVTNRLTQEQRRIVLSKQSLSDYVSRIQVFFASGHHTPAESENRKIQAVAAKLAITETDEKLMIIGLTDGKGDDETNKWIKNERCNAVYNLLIEMGSDESRLILQPNAEGRRRSNETAEQLRRVEFHVISPEAQN
ncbi:MAG: outer membrane protein OmpA-like peptidoglycan-associated protein [Verrucomicrobiales bacterium]|jgi:outer membrane protein OmpA-like peptidoglycan-associated protein